jgi:hypothetical protein
MAAQATARASPELREAPLSPRYRWNYTTPRGTIVFAGARIIRTNRLPGTIAIDAVANLGPGEGVFSLGGNASLIDGVADEVFHKTESDVVEKDLPRDAVAERSDVSIADQASAPKAPKKRAPKQSMKFARPANLREMK